MLAMRVIGAALVAFVVVMVLPPDLKWLGMIAAVPIGILFALVGND